MAMSERMRQVQRDQQRIRDRVRQSMLSGLAIAVPLLVTLFVFQFATGFLLDALQPLAGAIQQGTGISGTMAVNVVAVVSLVLLIFVVGFVAESEHVSGRFENSFDHFMSSIPGLGSVYSSFNEMSQLLLDNDTQSFKEVKLVEYPTEGSYSVAFVTAETPSHICDATGNAEMTTLYMPMAPNPVMGGFVLHIEDEKVYEVDMTVEEGVQSIVTSGIAVGETSQDVEAQTVERVADSAENVHLPEETEDTNKRS